MTKNKKRRLSFRLKTLFVVITLWCVLLGWCVTGKWYFHNRPRAAMSYAVWFNPKVGPHCLSYQKFRKGSYMGHTWVLLMWWSDPRGIPHGIIWDEDGIRYQKGK
jgi:hypothetical protein